MTGLTKQRRDAIVKLVAGGMSLRRAAPGVGVSHVTAYKWHRLGQEEESDQKYKDFYNAVEQAHSDCIKSNVALIERAAIKHWQAAAWLLERRFPHEYGRLERVEQTRKDEEVTQVEFIVPEEPEEAEDGEVASSADQDAD